MPNNTNPWSMWLEDFPRAQYGATIPRGAPSFEDYWRGRYGNVWGQYQTALGRQAKAGLPPSLSFGEFLGSFPFAERYGLLSPGQKGFRQPQRLSWRV